MNARAALRIRAAVVEDCDAIGRLHVDAWRETYPGLMPPEIIDRLGPAERAAQWASGLARGAKGPIVRIAEAEDGSLAGFGAAGPVRDAAFAWQAEIYALYVLQRHQRCGGGVALLRHLAAALAERGRHRVGLWVLTGNAGARAFYERIDGRSTHQRVDESEGWACDETAYAWDDLAHALEAMR
jgi:ribosomal protein S18 acetylase RimI-like enzyme